MNDQLTVVNELNILGQQYIAGYQFTGIEGGFGEGKKALLVKEIAEIHSQPLGEINRRINDNRIRFKDGLDIADLKNDGFEPSLLNSLGFSNRDIAISKSIYLLSERGYAKLLKILEDDTAWELYDQFVDGYFNMREQHPKAMDAKESILANMQVTLMLNQEVTTVKEEVAHVKEDVEQIKKDINERITLDYGQQQVMRNAVNKRVYQLWNENKVDKNVYDTVKKVYSALWKNLKDGYQVNAYPNILQKDFDEAMSFIKGWRPLLKGNQTA